MCYVHFIAKCNQIYEKEALANKLDTVQSNTTRKYERAALALPLVAPTSTPQHIPVIGQISAYVTRREPRVLIG